MGLRRLLARNRMPKYRNGRPHKVTPRHFIKRYKDVRQMSANTVDYRAFFA